MSRSASRIATLSGGVAERFPANVEKTLAIALPSGIVAPAGAPFVRGSLAPKVAR